MPGLVKTSCVVTRTVPKVTTEHPYSTTRSSGNCRSEIADLKFSYGCMSYGLFYAFALQDMIILRLQLYLPIFQGYLVYTRSNL